MKVIILLFLAAVALAGPARPFYSLDKADEYFQQFVETYNKQYASEAEKARRLEIFKHNLDLINQRNAESETAVYGITLFSDLSNEEFIERHTGSRGGMFRNGSGAQIREVKNKTVPDSWDWKKKGIISKVKDQGFCRSDWAFSAIGNVEAQYARIHKDVLDLSAQQLVDCDGQSYGCFGTQTLVNPFKYFMENTGSVLEKDYPYKDAWNRCKVDKSKVKVKVHGYSGFAPQNEEQLKVVLYEAGPVSLWLDPTALQSYRRGIIQNCPAIARYLAALLVGYGTEHGVPYWVIKTSWGEEFGEQGYFRVKRGIDGCGIMESEFLVAIVE